MEWKELTFEIIGLVLFCADQITDMVILYQGDFYNERIKIAMYVTFFFNIFVVFFWLAFKNIIYTNFFASKFIRKSSIKQRQSTKDHIFHYISLFCSYFWNAIVGIFSYFILTIIQMIILWFGFYKLYRVDPIITDNLSQFLFLKDQNEWLINPQSKKIKQPKNQSLQIQQQQLQQEQQQEQQPQQQKQEQKQSQQQQQSQSQKQEQQQSQQQEQPQSQQQEGLQKELHDESKYKMQNSEIFCKKMQDMCLKLELVEKIFENFAQLIIQTINFSLQGNDFTKVQIISLTCSCFDIVYSIILAVFYGCEQFRPSFDKLKEITQQIIQEIKRILKIFPYIELIQILQAIFYMFITVSYGNWYDYRELEDNETHGKDQHDSIRTFIIIFPFAFLINTAITLYHQYYIKSMIDLQRESDVIFQIIPLLVKNAVIVQMCFDLLVFSAPPFEYGQSIMNGQKNMNIFLVIIIISQFAETGLFYWRIIKNDIENLIQLAFNYFTGIICIILEIKFFSHWVNLAYYYDWTDLDIKHTITIGSQCNDDLERTIRGYLITFLVFWIGKYVVCFIAFEVKYDKESFLYHQNFIFIIFFTFTFCNWVISICYLSYRAENKFCDDLQFVQKEDKALLIIHVIIQPFIVVPTLFELVNQSNR